MGITGTKRRGTERRIRGVKVRGKEPRSSALSDESPLVKTGEVAENRAARRTG